MPRSGKALENLLQDPASKDIHGSRATKLGHRKAAMKGYLAKIDAMGREFVEKGAFNYVFPDKGHLGLLKAFADAIMRDEPSPLHEMSGMRATYLSRRAMDCIRLGTSLPVNVEDWDMYVHV